MKLNILLDNPGGALAGYTNIDPFAPPAGDWRVRCNPSDLSALADQGEVEELLAYDILDYYPLAQADKALSHWVSLLAHGGRIAVSCVDLLDVTKALQSRLINVQRANELLHGEQKKPWQFRHANYTLTQLAEMLKAKGLRVLKKRINDFRAFVVAERP